MKKSFLTHFLVLLTTASGYSQQIKPERLGFRSFSINDKNLGEVNFYVTSQKIDERKPVILYLDGSGANPLFQFTKQGIISTVPLDCRSLANDYHVVLISKPGVPFIDSVKNDPLHGGMPYYPHPESYKKRLSLDWRVNSAQLVLGHIRKNLKVNESKIAVLGISEGFQVGARLAHQDKSFTHAMLYVGNGLNQFYDFIIQNRVDAQAGVITEAQAQKNIDSLYSMANSIYEHPNSTEKEWFGHTYLRWSSFTRSNPMENLLSLSIPIYIVGVSKDRNSSILSTDYLFLESIARGKRNVTYRVFPYDHSFNEEERDARGAPISLKNHMIEVIEDGLTWLKGA